MLEVDPQQLDALSRLGVAAFFIALTALWLKRWIITGTEKKESDAVWAARLAERDVEIARLLGLLTALTKRMGRFQSVLERVTGIQVPPDPDDE